jgi:hypothetical protein
MNLSLILAAALGIAVHSSSGATSEDDSKREEAVSQQGASWSVVGDWRITLGEDTDTLSVRQDGTFSGFQGAKGNWLLSASGGTPLLVLRREGGGAETLEMRSPDHFQGADGNHQSLDLRRGPEKGATPRREGGGTKRGGKMRDAFSGKIRFHQSGGKLTYDLTVDHGRVNGTEHFGDADRPVAHIVGGWFDRDGETLSLLIEGSDGANERWRVQAQQFTVNPEAKTVTMEHALYGKGLTSENSKLTIDHTLDLLEASP